MNRWTGRSEKVRKSRARGARILLLVVLALLVSAFFRLQVLRSSRFELRSEENRLRAISIPPPRGTIYDRNGRVLAENVPGYSVTLLPGRVETIRAALDRLAPFLDLGPGERRRLVQKYGRNPARPLVVRDDASFQQVSAIEERRPRFRRSVVEMRPRRRYPFGPALAHVIGYVGEIGETELQRRSKEGYEAGRKIGRTGIEEEYESRLGGEPGVRYVEVNALGSIVREFGPRSPVPPEPGEDLTLALDLGLQLVADSIFPRGRRGGVVALDPDTGEVLVLYSHPGFDPNVFVGGIDSSAWAALRDDPDRALLNRVTAASYPPGSTWKLFVALEAMRRNEVGIEDRMEMPCRGAFRYGNRSFRCWRPEGHGSLTLSSAVKRSCNVYFYQLGLELGLDRMIEAIDRLGFREPSGIDLPTERGGLFPESRAWLDRRYGRSGWTESVALNLAIGQGENSQTLLRQALFYSALATGRTPVVPHLLRSDSLASRRVGWSLGIPEARRRELVDALKRVVNEPGGTAYPWRLREWTLAGKTGTAQNPQGEPHSWFVGFAPAEDPEIVVAALVEFGHPDNTTSLAVPVAARIVRRFLERRAGGELTPAEPVVPDRPFREVSYGPGDGRGPGPAEPSESGGSSPRGPVP